MEKPDNRAFVYEIEQAISQVEKYVTDIEKDDFEQDKKLQDAVIYRLMIIGEASSKITTDYSRIKPPTLVGGSPKVSSKIYPEGVSTVPTAGYACKIETSGICRW